jgi:hypothetical protein
MALWGNNDNVGSNGNVSLDYDTRVVTGSGTTFGNVGAAKTGDVIRFGAAFGNGVNIGDAVVVGIASTTQLSIASTAGLSGAAISGVQFQISESPKFAVLDSHLNQSGGGDTETITVLVSAATTNAGIGTNIVFVNSLTGIIAGDTFVSGVDTRIISTVGVTSVSLASTISAGIATAAVITFSRVTGGHETSVIGVEDAGTEAAVSTKFKLTHAGWVGVTTYRDSEGNIRVKSEVLVAMSGITTGNNLPYPPF